MPNLTMPRGYQPTRPMITITSTRNLLWLWHMTTLTNQNTMMSRLVLPLPMTPGRALRAGHLVQDLLPPLQVPTLLQRGTIPKIRHQGSLAVVVVAAAAVAV